MYNDLIVGSSFSTNSLNRSVLSSFSAIFRNLCTSNRRIRQQGHMSWLEHIHSKIHLVWNIWIHVIPTVTSSFLTNASKQIEQDKWLPFRSLSFILPSSWLDWLLMLFVDGWHSLSWKYSPSSTSIWLSLLSLLLLENPFSSNVLKIQNEFITTPGKDREDSQY